MSNAVVDPFGPATLEGAIAMIESYAKREKITPAELVDILNTGIVVRSIALGQREEFSHA